MKERTKNDIISALTIILILSVVFISVGLLNN